MARQRCRIRWLQDGDANSKLFHGVAKGRRTNNYIAALRHGDEIITDQARKEEVFSDAYNTLIGNIQTRDVSLDLGALGHLQRVDPNGHRGSEFIRPDRPTEKQRFSGPT
jgi:hypothetical protein